MFTLSDEHRRVAGWLAYGFTAVGIFVLWLSRWIQANRWSEGAWLLVLAGLALYLWDMRDLYRRRRRRQLELNSRYAIIAFLFLAIVLLVGLLVRPTAMQPMDLGLTFWALYGWLGGLALTQLYKIVPFLTLLEHVTDRVERIDRALITRANDVGEYLSEHRLSIFPQYRLSDRVDWVARELGQGKIAIIVENDPFVILLPMTLVDFYQTSQDYSLSWWDGTLVRLIRLTALIIGLYLMPLYIALTSVDVDLIPTPLLLTIAGSRQGIPFPPVVEVIIMYVIIEILREAANRLPKELAVTLGTVGAVVVGTAIVKAGIVDDVMIVSATLTALGLFSTPAFEMSTPWRWLFWVMVLGAYTLGIFGMLMVTVGIVGYMASLEPFGVPYLSPFGPLRTSSLADAWLRAPAPALKKRPTSLRPQVQKEASPNVFPDPFQLRPSDADES